VRQSQGQYGKSVNLQMQGTRSINRQNDSSLITIRSVQELRPRDCALVTTATEQFAYTLCTISTSNVPYSSIYIYTVSRDNGLSTGSQGKLKQQCCFFVAGNIAMAPKRVFCVFFLIFAPFLRTATNNNTISSAKKKWSPIRSRLQPKHHLNNNYILQM